MNLHNTISNTHNKYSTQSCVYCGKGYKNRSNLEKHINLCELVHKSKKYRNDEDEDFELPSQKKMFQMLLELGQKYSRLEEKVDEMNKWVLKKKKKINVLEWLNSNIVPDLVFEDLHEKIVIIDSDIEFLLQNSLLDTMNEVLSRTVYNMNMNMNMNMSDISGVNSSVDSSVDSSVECVIPLFAFVQKANIFYVFSKNNDNNTFNNNDDIKGVWIELPREILKRFFMKIQMKISKAFCEWKKKRTDKNRDDESFDILCDKTIVKIMGTEFNQDTTFGKMKTTMYNKMKTDMKSLIEYEFEF